MTLFKVEGRGKRVRKGNVEGGRWGGSGCINALTNFITRPFTDIVLSVRLTIPTFLAPTQFFMLSTNPLRAFSLQRSRVFVRRPSPEKPILSVAPSTAGEEMDLRSPCVLVLSGKSPAEMEFAKTLKSSSTLKLPDNSEVRIFVHPDTQRPPSEESFQIDLFLKSLLTNQFGRFFIWSPRLPSTHDVVTHNFCELPIGAVCAADIQSKGRGRSKNLWESPIGCLLFSFTIQMVDGKIVPLLQYVISLAITEAIKEICDKNGLPYLDVRIKWPNDLYLNGLKVGGILCTSTYKSKKFNVSAGIGLNVDNEKPTVCLNAVLRELSIISYKFTREVILAAFFNKFEYLYNLFIDQGFQALEELYYKTWLHSGQRIIVQEKNEEQVVENVVTIQGLTPSGYLLAVGEDNQMCELHPDGNSFDFFKGLVRRKL